MNISPAENLPDYVMNYLGGDQFVRGYEPAILSNPEQVRNKLKFNNFIYASCQLEIPWFEEKKFKTNMLFFVDQAIGSNKYNVYDSSNRIIGYGFGFQIITKDNTQFDIHVGLNKYHNEIIHFMVKRNV